ncbi:MAG: uroporphyrinogen-III synthase [Candidatus Tectomicrobia bacterium]|uniref:Uroporphyrinogen-III synthase n=1 Tax=Tectimicrobiota bacterium TaxID=2528274 RepID=A0A932I0C0_UNCTE|nr:uroporphyrinogen-III synthase [Candidatus Tectomicrobia bacterium]
MGILAGKTVVITGQRRGAEMAEMVRRLGGEPRLVPTVNLRFEEAKEEAGRLARLVLEGVDAAVFYTGVGARAVAAASDRLGRKEAFLDALRKAWVLSRGRKALRALREIGRPPDAEAEPGTTEGVIEALAGRDLDGRRVWVQTPGALPRGLGEYVEARGGRLLHGSPYRFLPPEDPAALQSLIEDLAAGRPDAATFTSPPAVHNLFLAADDAGCAEALAEALGRKILTASIGPVTSAALREHGVEPGVESPTQRMGDLLHQAAGALSAAPARPS